MNKYLVHIVTGTITVEPDCTVTDVQDTVMIVQAANEDRAERAARKEQGLIDDNTAILCCTVRLLNTVLSSPIYQVIAEE